MLKRCMFVLGVLLLLGSGVLVDTAHTQGSVHCSGDGIVVDL